MIGCQAGLSSPLAPSLVAPAALPQAALHTAAAWGSVATARTMAASQSSAFPCALGPFGPAARSHFVISASGNASLVCGGPISGPPPQEGATTLTDFPCTLPSGTVTVRSRFVLAPSGEATLTCQSR